MTWGYPYYGGDSRAVQGRLKHVQQIKAGWGAFAAILGDGSVVTWGDVEFAADSSTVQTQLKNVQQIQASLGAFAAILDADSSTVTVQTRLKNVQQIQASEGAFAAILGDGSVVTWVRLTTAVTAVLCKLAARPSLKLQEFPNRSSALMDCIPFSLGFLVKP